MRSVFQSKQNCFTVCYLTSKRLPLLLKNVQKTVVASSRVNKCRTCELTSNEFTFRGDLVFFLKRHQQCFSLKIALSYTHKSYLIQKQFKYIHKIIIYVNNVRKKNGFDECMNVWLIKLTFLLRACDFTFCITISTHHRMIDKNGFLDYFRV